MINATYYIITQCCTLILQHAMSLQSSFLHYKESLQASSVTLQQLFVSFLAKKLSQTFSQSYILFKSVSYQQ